MYPDDWGNYYRRCPTCNYPAHASEGYACKCECNACGNPWHEEHKCGDEEDGKREIQSD